MNKNVSMNCTSTVYVYGISLLLLFVSSIDFGFARVYRVAFCVTDGKGAASGLSGFRPNFGRSASGHPSAGV